jgi:transcriptional regulator with XRE-family HTH domain
MTLERRGGSEAASARLAAGRIDLSDDPGHDLGDLDSLKQADPEAYRAYIDHENRRNLYVTFGFFRRLLGLSQSDIAAKMKTSQSSISEIEKGLNDARLTTLQRLARALGLELRISLSTRWSLLDMWQNRSLAYGTSVGPLTIDSAPHEQDVWEPLIPTVIRQTFVVFPVATSRANSDDLLTNRDVLELAITHGSASSDDL